MDIVMLHRQGLSKRQIAGRLGIHRDTVSRYLERGGEPPAAPATRRGSALGEFAERIKAWMEEDDYHATWMHPRLRTLGFGGGVRAVQRFVRGVRDRLVRKAFLRFETEPGLQAQVDFAEMAVVDDTGETIAKYHMFLMVLGFSRKRYAELLLRPDLTSSMEAHQRAFRFFGGVPTEILYDCMKTVVTRVCGHEPQWNEGFHSFAEHTSCAGWRSLTDLRWKRCCGCARHTSPILRPSVTISGSNMPNDILPDWERVLTSAAHLQRILPGAVLVGGSASVLYAKHRLSSDADHVLTDLRQRFDQALAELESVAGWKTARVKRPVQILGSLDGIETGVRQFVSDQVPWTALSQCIECINVPIRSS